MKHLVEPKPLEKLEIRVVYTVESLQDLVVYHGREVAIDGMVESFRGELTIAVDKALDANV